MNTNYLFLKRDIVQNRSPTTTKFRTWWDHWWKQPGLQHDNSRIRWWLFIRKVEDCPTIRQLQAGGVTSQWQLFFVRSTTSIVETILVSLNGTFELSRSENLFPGREYDIKASYCENLYRKCYWRVRSRYNNNFSHWNETFKNITVTLHQNITNDRIFINIFINFENSFFPTEVGKKNNSIGIIFISN